MNTVTYEAVYYVNSPDVSLEVNPIGIRPHIGKDKVWWDDTNPTRGRSFRVKKVDIKGADNPPKKIELITDEGKKVTLLYLTLEVYNQNVRDKVVGNINFNTNEEVQKFYLTTDFSE